MVYLLHCHNVSKTFISPAGSVKAVNRVNFAFPEKGLISISGKSGCGKSTLLSLLSSLEVPTSGKIYYQGKDISSMSPSALASFRLYEVGMVFQHYNLLSECNVIENVELPLLMEGMPKAKARKQAEAALNKFFLSGFAKRDVSTLSGGEKQRVAICRALVHSPKILLADEPTGALDEKNSRVVMDELKRLSKTILVILVSHNKALVEKYSDQILWMENGRIINFPESSPMASPRKMRTSHSSSFASMFAKRNMKENRLANVLCASASAVGFLSILISVGYFNGGKQVEQNLPLRNLDSSVAKIYKQEKYSLEDSPLSLVEQVAPEIHEAQSALGDDYIVEHDLSFFAPNEIGFELDGVKVDPCAFSPCYSLTSNYGYSLEAGDYCPAESLSYCIVNDLFLSTYGCEGIGQTIQAKIGNELSYGGESESVDIHLKMKITGVVHEFSFLNTPKIYYSFIGLRYALEIYPLPILSAVKGEQTNPYEWVASSKGDSPISSYGKLVFTSRFEDCPKLLKTIVDVNEKEEFAMESRSYSAISSFSTLSEAFQGCLLFFVGIAAISLVCILATSAFASFARKKKEASILYCLGARKGDVESIFARESCFFSLLGCVSGIALSPLAELLINLLMGKSFDVEGAVSIPWLSFLHVPLLLPALCLIGALGVSLLVTRITLFFAGRVSPMEELRDE